MARWFWNPFLKSTGESTEEVGDGSKVGGVAISGEESKANEITDEEVSNSVESFAAEVWP